MTSRNQADVAALLPGKVIELQSDTLNATHSGPGVRLALALGAARGHSCGRTVEVSPPAVPANVVGARLYALVRDFAHQSTDSIAKIFVHRRRGNGA